MRPAGINIECTESERGEPIAASMVAMAVTAGTVMIGAMVVTIGIADAVHKS